MNTNETQGQSLQTGDTQMNPDEIASSLAFATHISEQMLPKDQLAPQDASQTPQNAPGQQMGTETVKDPQKEKKAQEADIKAQVQKAVEEQLAPIKEALQAALDEDQNN